ncbi:hypothetical protein KUV65_06660 [Maritalea mobilis]|uniref:hypothetical protein n=1 Tax=Maritalea mobilis TaxID=483324 RepID=UPI001C985E44|nr:hypothetical protein [Maritalea mobilis]MBY6201036.1 hypothetical protein [Maritalea mobilis]
MLKRLVAMIKKMDGHGFMEPMTCAMGGGASVDIMAPAPRWTADARLHPTSRPTRPSDCYLTPSPLSAVSHLLGPSAVERRVVMLAPEGSTLLRHASWLDDATQGCSTTSEPADVRGAPNVGDSPGAILLVDLAVFPRLATAIDWLIALRNDVPGVVVAVAFDQFPEHDMSCERFQVADVSVRLPISRPALGLAVSAAMTNHRFTLPLRRKPMQH